MFGVKHINESFVSCSKVIFIIKSGQSLQKIFEIGKVIVFVVKLTESIQKRVKRVSVMVTAPHKITDSKRITFISKRIGLQKSNKLIGKFVKFFFNEEFNIEKVENLIVGLEIKSAQKVSNRHFSGTVNAHGNGRGGIGLQLNPRPAIGNHGRSKN